MNILKTIYFKTALCICLSISLFAFNKKDVRNQFDAKKIQKELCLIPGGQLRIGETDLNKGKWYTEDSRLIVEIDSFYLCNHEVTNLEYWIFLKDIKNDSAELYWEMHPDTLIWRNELGYNDDYIELYFRHPAYANYPVVGVSYEQVSYYCTWLTKKYNQSSKRKHLNGSFKLPTRHQWNYAANGLGFSVLPTPNGTLKDKKGNWLANFQVFNQIGNPIDTLELQRDCHSGTYKKLGILNPSTYSSISAVLGGSGDNTCDVYSFKTNYYGLHNMAGNVSEYTREVGILKGGSWMTTGYYLMNIVDQQHDVKNSKSSSDRGFRVAFEIAK